MAPSGYDRQHHARSEDARSNPDPDQSSLTTKPPPLLPMLIPGRRSQGESAQFWDTSMALGFLATEGYHAGAIRELLILQAFSKVVYANNLLVYQVTGVRADPKTLDFPSAPQIRMTSRRLVIDLSCLNPLLPPQTLDSTSPDPVGSPSPHLIPRAPHDPPFPKPRYSPGRTPQARLCRPSRSQPSLNPSLNPESSIMLTEPAGPGHLRAAVRRAFNPGPETPTINLIWTTDLTCSPQAISVLRAKLSGGWYPNNPSETNDQNILQADNVTPNLVPSEGYTYPRNPGEVG